MWIYIYIYTVLDAARAVVPLLIGSALRLRIKLRPYRCVMFRRKNRAAKVVIITPTAENRAMAFQGIAVAAAVVRNVVELVARQIYYILTHSKS